MGKAESELENSGKVEVFRKYRVWAGGGRACHLHVYECLSDGPSPESSVLFIGGKRRRPPEAVQPLASQYSHRAMS